MTATALAVLDDYAAAIEQAADPGQYVIQACERAKAWLANVLEHGDIDQIVEVKSQAEAIRIYAMSRQLGEDAKLAATEVIRRAERGLGLAIRKGQAEGTIKTRRDGGWHRNLDVPAGNKKTPISAYLSGGKQITETFGLTDGVTDEAFDAAVEAATAELNLSRSNVLRKLRGKRTTQPGSDEVTEPPSEPEPVVEPELEQEADEDWIPSASDRTRVAVQRRRELIGELAPQGYTSGQIGDLLGIGDQTVRRIARAEGVDLSADRAVGRYQTRRIDSNNVIRGLIQDLADVGAGLDLVNYGDLDRDEVPDWIASLSQAIRVLNQLHKRLKETIQ